VDSERLLELDHALASAVADASEHAALVAEAAAERYGFPAGFLARYFEHLQYRFTDRKREGLQRYFELAAQAGIIETAPELVFAGARHHGAEA
ncbi:MAG: MqnA/MqnD/SBP family protein, partial [Gaiellales bacterium]